MANKYAAFSKRAQKNRVKTKMCLNKAAYETEEAAYQKGQRSYKCKFCQKWHRSRSLMTLVKKHTDPIYKEEK